MITHILKDGTVLEDISRHVVNMKDAQQAYLLIDKINQAAQRHKERTERSVK